MTSKPKPQTGTKKAKKTLKIIAKTTIDQTEFLGGLEFYKRQELIWGLECPAPEKLVLLSLNQHADSNGECFPGLKRIQKKCGLTRADRIIDRLIAKGLITNYSRFDNEGRMKSNGYQILFKSLKEANDNKSKQDDTVSMGGRHSVVGEDDTVSSELDHSESIQLTNPNELDQLTPEREREEVFDEEVISEEFVSESEPTRSDFVVQQPKDSAFTQDDRREDPIAAAPKISQDWNYSAMGPIDVVSVDAVVTTDEPCTTSQYIDVVGNGFEGFKAKYMALCESVNRSFGNVEQAEEAWRLAWRGLEPPQDFWDGLEHYRLQQVAEFERKRECWTLGAKRFLSEEKWLSAIRIHARDSHADSLGIDMHCSPELARKEAIQKSNLRNWEIAKQRMAEKKRLAI